MRRFALGDCHGRFEALKQCFERSKFDPKEDLLIVLGDIVDGGYNTAQVVEELLKVENLIFIMGNHDEWFMNHIAAGWAEEIWLQQGGANTLRSYGAKVEEAEFITDRSVVNTSGLNIPVTHQDFFNRAIYYYTMSGMLFVHGGINPAVPKMSSQRRQDLLWDRNLINFAKKKPVPGFDKVFVGHTAIKEPYLPQKHSNLWNLDTGSGWRGKLTIMNVDTEEYWQSDLQEPAIGGK